MSPKEIATVQSVISDTDDDDGYIANIDGVICTFEENMYI